jgi:hypothetical protein
MVPKLEREELEEAVAHFRFAEFARPDFIVDREARAWDLERRSPHAARLIPLGTATVPDLGIARRGPVVYSFYRVDWSGFDASRPSP